MIRFIKLLIRVVTCGVVIPGLGAAFSFKYYHSASMDYMTLCAVSASALILLIGAVVVWSWLEERPPKAAASPDIKPIFTRLDTNGLGHAITAEEERVIEATLGLLRTFGGRLVTSMTREKITGGYTITTVDIEPGVKVDEGTPSTMYTVTRDGDSLVDNQGGKLCIAGLTGSITPTYAKDYTAMAVEMIGAVCDV